MPRTVHLLHETGKTEQAGRQAALQTRLISRAAKDCTQVLTCMLGYLAQWQRELEHLTSVDFHFFILSGWESLAREGPAGEGMSWHCSSLSLALEVFSANNIKLRFYFGGKSVIFVFVYNFNYFWRLILPTKYTPRTNIHLWGCTAL